MRSHTTKCCYIINLIFLIVLSFTNNTLISQSTGLGVYANSTKYFTLDNNRRSSASYEGDVGFKISLNKQLKTGENFSLFFEKFGGSTITRVSSLGTSSLTKATVSSYVLGCSFLPYKIQLVENKFLVLLGLEMSYHIDNNLVGYNSLHHIGTSHEITEFNDDTKDFFNKFQGGLDITLGYILNIKDNLQLRPTFQFYLPITSQFSRLQKTTSHLILRLGFEVSLPSTKKAESK